ncbi:unnamed protein product, partial [Brassica oleracea]
SRRELYLYDKVCAVKGVSQEKAHIWDYADMRKVNLLDPLSDKTLKELGLLMEQNLSLVDMDRTSINAMVRASIDVLLGKI